MNANSSLQSLSLEIHSDLDEAMQMLGKNLNQVESELDLECANLRDLVNQRNPEVQKQLDALGKSITELHQSLDNVRQKLQTAHHGSEELQEATKLRVVPSPKPKPSDAHPAAEDQLSPQEAGRIRHDEKITLSGIFRALFMAEEPGQRFIHPPKDE